MPYLDNGGLNTLWTKIKNTFSQLGHTHSYNDLTDKPAIPTKVSQLTNDSGYTTNTGTVTTTGTMTSNHVVTSNGGTVIKDSGFSIAKSVPSDAKFTDTVTTATTSGSGNAVTAITASNGALTITKGSTFLTNHQDISGKEDTLNKVSQWSSVTNNTRYPSEKLVKDSINDVVSYVDTTVQSIGSGFKFKGSVNSSSNLPSSGNTVGDLYISLSDGTEWVWTSRPGTTNAWVQLYPMILPSENGVYAMKCTVVNGSPSIGWVKETGDYLITESF